MAAEDETAEARRLMTQAQAADTAYRLAAVKVAVCEFLHQYGHSTLPAFKVALDLAVFAAEDHRRRKRRRRTSPPR